MRKILREKILKQKEHEQRELEHISRKLERIRARTCRLEGETRDSWTHYDGWSFYCFVIGWLLVFCDIAAC